MYDAYRSHPRGRTVAPSRGTAHPDAITIRFVNYRAHYLPFPCGQLSCVE